MNKLELMIFDMAGTTIQITDQVPKAFQTAFKPYNIDLSNKEIRQVRGYSKKEAILRIVKNHLKEISTSDQQKLASEIYLTFNDILLSSYQHTTIQPIEGTKDVFQWLKKKKVKIALTTGFNRQIAEFLVDKLHWHKVVNCMICNDDVPKGRPAPYLIFRAMEKTNTLSVDNTAIVGDTTADLQSAENAGVKWSFGVTTGAYSKNLLKKQNCTAILNSIKNIPQMLKKLKINFN